MFSLSSNLLSRADIDLVVQQDRRRTEWCARVQLWDSQKLESVEVQNPDSPSTARRLSDAPSQLNNTSPLSGQSNSNQASQYGSMPTFQSSTTRVMAVTSLMEGDTDGGMGIDANLFEPPKQPLLVLFLRPSGQRSHQHRTNYLSLMKIPSKSITHLRSTN